MMKSETFAEFQLSKDRMGKHATGHGLVVTADGQSNICHRRCIRIHTDGRPSEHDSILRCELNGVKVYVKPPGNIIVTTEDLKL